MKEALYCPVYGYYEKEADTAGRCGDYYTSVSVGSLFGELLALQLARWLEPLTEGTEQGAVQIVEAGAHRGDLAADILAWLHEHRSGVFERVEYWIVEPSDARERSQRRTLDKPARFGHKVHWVKTLEQVAEQSSEGRQGGINGVIISNELLDAMPAHRFGWDAGKRSWFEWGVALQDDDERFCWTRLRALSVEAPIWPRQILDVLPDGFTVETCPAAVESWAAAASRLARGKLLTFDYGFTDEEWLSPERRDGTLRAYRGQRISDDVIRDPGEQDITAHVNFSPLIRAGEAAGLTTEGLFSQEEFLTKIAAPILERKVDFGPWTKERIRQFQTLTHPEHLGRAFRVLIQSR